MVDIVDGIVVWVCELHVVWCGIGGGVVVVDS